LRGALVQSVFLVCLFKSSPVSNNSRRVNLMPVNLKILEDELLMQVFHR